ncbi:unnamed protein product [Phytomonas sp. EM1]|nr:unnamed protein product [Phytomonas sp. EM1]|eukprot:CCW65374.1 unnamed protein product [Phytomonas sp. isolate EM1]
MEVLSLRIKIKARAACSIRNEVWFALQKGGLAVYDAETHEHLNDIPIDLDGCKAPQIRRVAAVLNEVWAVTSDGQVFSVDTRSYKITNKLQLPGSGKKVELMDISFNGCLVILASEAGYVLGFHPSTKELVFSFPTSAPCTAVMQFSSIIAAGDREGALYLWDTLTSKCLSVHTQGRSDVLKLLYETTHNRLWVARRNSSIDLYDFNPSDGRLLFYKRLTSVGIVTGMVTVGGRVVVSTHEKQLVIVDVANARILHTQEDTHKMFIHDVVKVRHTEIAELWSLGNDGAAFVCLVNGCAGPVYVPPLMGPKVLKPSSSSLDSVKKTENKPLAAAMASEQSKLFDVLDDLRRAREEAQEMRLRSTRLEESLKVKNDEIATQSKELKDLANRVSALTKNVTDITSEKRSVERECIALQSELNLAKSDALRASADAASQMAVKIRAQEEVSQQKADAARMEQHLRDTESRLASLQAENIRLRESVDNNIASKSIRREAPQIVAGSPAPERLELEKTLRLNYSLSCALTSMECTLRRKEEEEKDLNALLNAYRLKAADHVSDSCLSALLIASIMRCPDRFELQCSNRILSQFRSYCSPFINFLDSLRNGDPETYQGLVQHLHQHAIGSAMSPQTQQNLDQLLVLAFKEGDLVGADALAAFKKAISTRITSGRNDNPVLGALPAPIRQKPPPNETGSASESLPSAVGRAAETVRTVGASMATPVSEKVAGISLHPIQSITSKMDIEEYRMVFEFILFTRRPLIEHLVLLHRSILNLRQKVEALALEPFPTSTLPVQSSTYTPASSHANLENPLQAIRPAITEIEELVSFVFDIYLTAAEKQRLSVG